MSEFLFIADLHTDGDWFRDRTGILREGFRGIREYDGIDAVITCGDITNCGDESEYENLLRLKIDYLGRGTFLPCFGNHDSWNQSADPDFPNAVRLFEKFCSDCGAETGNVYYEKTVCGHPFIFLGTERIDFDGPYISPAQSAWFEKALTSAAETGRDMFVVFHQPPEGSHGFTGRASMGEYSAEFNAIMMKCAKKTEADVFFVSGHTHKFGDGSALRIRENLYYINIPSFEYGIGEEMTDRSAGLIIDTKNKNNMFLYNFIEKRIICRVVPQNV